MKKSIKKWICLFFHWAIIVNFLIEIAYSSYMIFCIRSRVLLLKNAKRVGVGVLRAQTVTFVKLTGSPQPLLLFS